jgi:hypothetical protein
MHAIFCPALVELQGAGHFLRTGGRREDYSRSRCAPASAGLAIAAEPISSVNSSLTAVGGQVTAMRRKSSDAIRYCVGVARNRSSSGAVATLRRTQDCRSPTIRQTFASVSSRHTNCSRSP